MTEQTTLPQPTEALAQAAEMTAQVTTADEIDALICDFESATRLVKAAEDAANDVKQRLIHLVQTHGVMPPESTASRRLAGRHNQATVTTGTTTTLNEPAVAEFRDYIESKGYPTMFDRFFAVETKHSLVAGAREVLATLKLPRMLEEKLYQLFGRTLMVKSKAASLKVSVITPEKPARVARAGKKAA